MRLKKIVSLTALTVMCASIPVFAASDTTASIEVESDEPISIIVQDLDEETSSTREIKDTGTIDLAFSEPGQYEYIISQAPKDGPYDDTVYVVDVMAYLEEEDESLTPLVTIYKGEEKEKVNEIQFTNKTESPTTTPAPTNPPEPTDIPEPSPTNALPSSSGSGNGSPRTNLSSENITDGKTPKTGDDGNIVIYSVIGLGSLACLLMINKKKA